MNVEPAPSKRILIILKAIMEARSVRFSDLIERVPVSRSGAWRALEALVEMGLIIKRSGDGRYRITEEAAVLFQNVEVPYAGADAVTIIMKAIREARGFEVDFGVFTSLGRFDIVESTRVEAYEGGALSLVFDDLCIAAQSITPMREVVRHIEAYSAFASPSERQWLHQGEHARLVTIARQDRITWADDGNAFSIGVQLLEERFGAFRLHNGKSNLDSLQRAARTIPKGSDLEPLARWIDDK